MEEDRHEHDADVVHEDRPVAGDPDHDHRTEGEERDRADDLAGALGEARPPRRDRDADDERDADDGADLDQHVDGVERDVLEQLLAGGVQRAPERDVERHRHDRQHVAHRGHRHRERHVAAGAVGEDVGDVAGRAAGHQDHAEGHRAAHVEEQGQHEGERREHQELRDDPDGDRPGPLGGGEEVRGAGLERDTEQDRADDDLQRRQRPLLEGDPDAVDVGVREWDHRASSWLRGADGSGAGSGSSSARCSASDAL